MKRVLVFCPRGFEPLEFASFIDVLGWAGSDYGHGLESVTCGFAKQVPSAFRVSLTVDVTFDEVCAACFDALAIPGGFEERGYYEDVFDERLLALIRDFEQAGKPVASVCVGALALARSGVLNGRRATTFYLQGGQRFKQLAAAGVNAVREPLVCDRGVITSCGPFTGPYAAFELLKLLIGAEAALEVKRGMGYADFKGAEKLL